MYGDILLIKEKKEKDSTAKINRVEIKTLSIMIKEIEAKVDDTWKSKYN